MRTNIEIDDDLMAEAMKAGPYQTKKEAVEAGLRLLARQAAYREILKWEGRLRWEGDDRSDWSAPDPGSSRQAQEPPPRQRRARR
jgi:Arc/MetJ family transcription regulator